MSLRLEPGAWCAIGDRVVAIDGMDSHTHVTARDVATGKVVRLEIARLRPLPQPARTTPEAGHIPQAEWDRCAALAKALQPFANDPRVPRAELQRIATKFQVSLRQVQRLRRRFQRSPAASTLARSSGGRPSGTSLLATSVNDVIQHAIRKYWFRRERAPKTHIVERVRSMCRRLQLPPPSPNAILRRIDAQVGYAGDARRLGAKRAKQHWEPRPGGFRAGAALDLVQIDHTRVDVMVVSADRKEVLGRPWITLAIDVHTRVVLGMYLSMDAPSSVSVSLCIEHAVLPKPEERARPGTWPMYGKPRCIHVDNGADLRALALQRGCQEHQIELQWRPVKTPHYGAHIERLNGTLMKLCHLLPGTTFSNPREKGDYDSKARATLTLAELRAWLVQKICGYYHVRRHRGLGEPPLVAWQRAFTDTHGEPVAPPLVAAPVDFRLDFLPFVLRMVTRTGLSVHGSRYWHEDLTPMINQSEPVMVRFDPGTPGCVWVRAPKGQVVEVPAVAGPAAGDPLRRITLDEQLAAELDAAVDAHFDACDSIEVSARRATRSARKRPSELASASAAKPSPDRTPDKTDSAAEDEESPHLPALRVQAVSPLPVEDWT